MIIQKKTISVTQPKAKPLYIVLDKIVSFQTNDYKDEHGQMVHCVDIHFVNGEHYEVACNSDTHANSLLVRLLKAIEGEDAEKPDKKSARYLAKHGLTQE